MLGGPSMAAIPPGAAGDIKEGGVGGDHTNHARELETAFCRDFYCCGLTLLDLHDLLQHYEECHVRFEEDEDCGLSIDGGGGDSEFFDDESWSDSESLSSSSRSSSSPVESVSGGSLSMTSRSTRQHYRNHHQPHFQQHPNGPTNKHGSISSSFFVPLSSPRQGGGGGRGSAGGGGGRGHHHLHVDNVNSTTHALEIFTASLGGAPKRRAVVSLSDIYAQDEGGYEHDDGDPSSAFLNTILRTRPTTSNSDSATTSNLLGPPAKRRALEPSQQQHQYQSLQQHQSQQSMQRHKQGQLRLHPSSGEPSFSLGKASNSAGYIFASGNSNDSKGINGHSSGFSGGVLPGAGALGRASAPASLSNIRPNMFLGSNNLSSTSAVGAALGGLSSLSSSAKSPYITAAVDLMRQRDEVYSIIEDMTKVPPNASTENKPYRCSVTGCDKAYKNPNGLKYHNLHGHCSNGLGDGDNPESKPYVCTFLECCKRYKNLNGLKYHIEHTHPNLIAALRAHQSGLANHPLIVNGPFPNGNAAAMTIAAALAAVEASPMMALAANAILTAQAAAANQANAASELASASSQSSSSKAQFLSVDSELAAMDGSSVSISGSGLPQVAMAMSGSLESAGLSETGGLSNIIPIAPAP